MMQDSINNRTIFCRDNLDIMRGINTESIDLIYLDPPFNKGKSFHAPIGTDAVGAEFSDIWTPDSIKDEWHNQINDKYPKLYKYLDAVGDINNRTKYYLIYMAVRLFEMHRILKPSGSLYLHCDPTASHYLKLLMDTIFGGDHFINEIIWHYKTGGMSKRWFGRKHDVLLFYGKSAGYLFNRQEEKSYLSHKYGFSNITLYEDEGGVYSKVGMRDVWVISALRGNQPEAMGYPTQKPIALLNRVIQSSSGAGDVILDPFCGCATTCIAAESLDRCWIGIDVSKRAFELVNQRIEKEIRPDLFKGAAVYREDIPARTDRDTKRKPTHDDKKWLYGEQNGKCAGCTTKFEIQHLEIDHIIPQSHGGWHERGNLQLLCAHCNRCKGDRPMEYLLNRLKAYR